MQVSTENGLMDTMVLSADIPLAARYPGRDTSDVERGIIVPLSEKLTLTIKEAAAYSGIGINKIDSLCRQPNCPFVLFNGTRKLVKRKAFEAFIERELVI